MRKVIRKILALSMALAMVCQYPVALYASTIDLDNTINVGGQGNGPSGTGGNVIDPSRQKSDIDLGNSNGTTSNPPSGTISPDTPSNTSGNGNDLMLGDPAANVQSGGIRFVEVNGQAIDTSQVTFNAIVENERQELPSMFDESAQAYLVGEPVGTTVEYRIAQADDSTYADCVGVVTLSSEDVEEISVEFVQKAGCGLAKESFALTYGGSPIDIKDLDLTVEGYDGVVTASAGAIDDVITVEDGVITPAYPGTSVVKLTASMTRTYMGAEILVPVTVSKMDLGVLSADDVVYSTVEKTYDGNREIQTSGNVAMLLPGDALSFDVTLLADAANAGTHTTTVSSWTVTSGEDLYDFTLNTEENAGPSAVINKLNADVSVSPLTVTYGDDTWAGLQAGVMPSGLVTAVCSVGNDDLQEELDAMTGYATLGMTAEDFLPGTKENAFYVTVSDPENSNFHFVTGDSADLIIEKKDLGQISPVYETVEKTYDGTQDFLVTGTVSDGLVGNDMLSVDVSLIADSKDVGTHTTTISSWTASSDNYTFTLDTEEGHGPSAVIEKAEAVVTVDPVTVAYGDSAWTSIKSGVVADPEQYISASSTVMRDELDAMTGYASLSVAEGTYEPGTSTDAITVTVSDPENSNFHFIYDGGLVPVVVAVNNLGELSYDDITFDTLEKVYDGSSEIHATGHVENLTDDVTFDVTLIADGANVGQHTTTVSSWTITEGGENYSFTLNTEEGAGPSVTILKADATVTVDPVTAVYGDVRWTSLRSGEILDPDSYIHVACDNESIKEELAQESGYASLALVKQNFAPGITDEAVRVTVTDPENSNFHFVYSGDLVSVIIRMCELGTISSDDITWGNVQKVYDGTDSFHVTGTIEEGLSEGDVITFEADLTSASANVGTYESTINEFNIIDGGDVYNFTLDTDEGAGPDVTITQAEALVSADDISVVYGDNAWTALIGGTVAEPMSYVHATCEDEDIQDELDAVSGYATLTPAKNDYMPGTVEDAVRVSLHDPEGCNFHFVSSDELFVSVTVLKKDLGVLDTDSVSWSSPDRTYDGTTALASSGTIDGVVDGDVISFDAVLVADAAGVGTHTTTITDWTVTGGADRYDFTLNTDEGNGPSAVINKVDAAVIVDPLTVVYGDAVWAFVRNGIIPNPYAQIHALASDSNLQRELDGMSDYATLTLIEDAYAPGTVSGAIRVAVEDPEDSNFHFVGPESADVIVRHQTKDDADIWSLLSPDEEASNRIYLQEDTIYAAPGAYIKFSVNSRLYDKAIFDVFGETSINYINVPFDAKNPVTGTVQLGDSQNANILSDADPDTDEIEANAIPDGAIIIDDQMPEITFSDELGTYTSLDVPKFEDLAMHVFRKDGYTATLTAEDDIAMSKFTYHLLKLAEGEEDVEGRIREAARTVSEWDIVPYGGNVRVPGTEDGYYVILACAADKVGNTVIVSSNGIVIDATPPAVYIEGLDLTKPANENVDFIAHIKDAGISRVDILAADKTRTETLRHIEEPEIINFKALGQDIGVPAVIDTSLFSGPVTVTVEAEDNAGNITTETRTIDVDTLAPEVIVSYDLDSPRNEKYFNEKRTMTVTIRERNFDPSRTGFLLEVDGREYSVLADEIYGDGIELISHTDSEDGYETYTDDRENTYTISFGAKNEDHDYRITPYAVDLADNVCDEITYESKEAVEAFTIDCVAPVLSYKLEFDGEEKTPGSLPMELFSRIPGNIVAVVTERNMTADPIDIEADACDYDGDRIPVAASVHGEGGVYRTDPFETEGNYHFVVSYTDLAGNTTSSGDFYFTYDETSPRGRIVHGDKVFETFEDKTSFGTFGNTDLVFNHEESDDVSGVAYVMYALYTPDVEARGTFDIPFDDLSGLDWVMWDDLVVAPDAQTVIYMKVVDYAGNASYVNTDGVIAETVAPGPSIVISTEKDYYNDDVPFTLHVDDAESGGTYSGLKAVNWYVEADNEVTQRGDYRTELSDPSARVNSLTRDEVIIAKLNNSNNVSLYVDAEDYAGNYSRMSKRLSIDATAPYIEGTYDRNDPANEKYFNTARTLTLRIREKNFDPDKALLFITVNGVRHEGLISDFEADGVSVMELPVEGIDHPYRIIFGADGKTDADFEVAVSVTDLAGNKTEEIDFGSSVASTAFTVDEVAPVLAYNLRDVDGNAVTASTVKATPYYSQISIIPAVVVNERNFSNAIIAKLTGADYSGKTVTGIMPKGTWAGDTYAYEPLPRDANYTFQVSYTDLAGNKAELPDVYFTIDSTAPEGTLSTIYGSTNKTSSTLQNMLWFGSFWNGQIRFRQTSSDQTSGVATVSYYRYTPTPETRGTFEIPGIDQLRMFDWRPWEDITLRPNTQAVIFLKIADRAGNITYISSADGVIADDVSPSAPVISVSAAEGVSKGDIPFSISVTDPESGGTYAGLRDVRWTVRRDGAVTQSGSYAGELSDSTARVQNLTKSETITADVNNSNNVVLTVEAEDYAGNTSSTSRTFAIDTTAPSVSIRYNNNEPINGKYFNTARQMTVSFTERNFDPAKALITVSINGSVRTVPVGSLSGNGISLVSVGDSQSGAGQSAYTDGRVVSYTYNFGDGNTDVDYDVTASITDAAGNTTSSVDYGDSNPQRQFTIDQVKPQLDFSYLTGNGSTFTAPDSPTSAFYDRVSVTAIANVIERNFDASSLVVTVSAKNAAGTEVKVSASGNWTNTGDLHICNFNPFTTDGIYTLEAMFTDLAGNTVSYGKHYFTVDKTAPTGSVTISGQSSQTFSSFNESVAFRMFTNRDLRVSQTSTDEVSGVARVQYYLYVPGIETRGTFRGLSLAELSTAPWVDWSGDLTIRPNMQTVVYVRIIDNAGNIAYMNARDGIVADDTNPENPVITIGVDPSPAGLYNQDVPFTIAVSDTERGGTYAGLRSVKWSVLKDGNVSQSGNYNGEFTDMTARVKSVTHNEVINAERNDSNNIRILVEVEDYAGNTSRAEKSLGIDVSKPIVKIEYGAEKPMNEFYYNKGRTATVTVIERNFDPQKVKLSAVDMDDAKPDIGKWSGEGDTHICTVRFDKDGDYTFTASAEDTAGNISDPIEKERFVVDTKGPVIGVTFDSESEDGGIYYNEDRTAVIVVKDKNFSEKDFAYRIVATLLGVNIDTPKTTKWVHKNDLHSTMITFEEDADYAFELACTDLAGNASEVFTQSRFVVDKTPPLVKFSGVEDESANRGAVEPLIEYTDINFNPKGINVILEGSSHEPKEVDGVMKADGRNGSFQMADFDHTQSVDDLYRLTAVVTDLAGNIAKESIKFSVNRFGSVYTFSDETSAFLEKYYEQGPQNLTIYETNIDGLKNVGITVGHDGNTKRLKSGSDYEAEVDETEKGWTVWTYNLKSSTFRDEGLYEVRIESVDAAGNRQDNSLKDKPVAFAIDRTPPSVIVTGIEDATRYTDTSKELNVTLSDNIAMGDAAILINGTEVITYDKVVDGRLQYTLEGTDDWQSVEIVAHDAAGNEARSGKRTVFIAKSKLRAVVPGNPFVIGGIIAGILAAGGIGGFFFYKRRKSKQGKGKTKELDRSLSESESSSSDDLS